MRFGGLFFRVMVSAFHLEGLNQILFCQVHVSMLVRVFCIDMQSSMVLMLQYTLVSSAQKEVKTSPMATSARLLIITMNSSGPKRLPWGNPEVTEREVMGYMYQSVYPISIPRHGILIQVYLKNTKSIIQIPKIIIEIHNS